MAKKLTQAQKNAAATNAIVAKYADYYKQYAANETANANQQKAAQESSAAAATRQAYTNNALGQTQLKNNMLRQGITGGASETSTVNQANNYNNVTSGISNNLATNKTSIDNSLRSNLNSYQLTNNQNLESALSAEKERQRVASETRYNRKINKQNVKEKRYANTIAGYDTVKSVNKAIKAAKKKGQSWKVSYLRAQRAAIKAAKKK